MVEVTEGRKTLEAIDARRSEAKTRESQVCIPLQDALLCLSCEIVYAAPRCPKCGDPFGWLLERWLSARAA